MEDPDFISLECMEKWYAEPLSGIVLDQSLFIKNEHGYPMFVPLIHEKLILLLKKESLWILSMYSEPNAFHGGLQSFLDYLKHVKDSIENDYMSHVTLGYNDFLQIPLQPLMDHLPSMVYETFELDPIKYDQYELAMYKALLKCSSDIWYVLCILKLKRCNGFRCRERPIGGKSYKSSIKCK